MHSKLLRCASSTLSALRARARIALLVLAAPGLAIAHSPAHFGTNPRGIERVDWQAEHIRHTFSAGYPDSFGLFAFFRREHYRLVNIDGQRCVRANFIALDVDENFAFDTDDTVSLSLSLAVDTAQTLLYAYDGNAGSGAPAEQQMAPLRDSPLQNISLELERARFANRGMAGTDIALTALATMDPRVVDEPALITLCGLSIARQSAPDEAAEPGRLSLDIRDSASGNRLAVRLGLYDASGRAALASDDALLVHHYEQDVRDTLLRDWEEWPEPSRWVFYSDGHYEQTLPAGSYTLIASRGPEYSRLRESFEITPGATTALDVTLKRWTNQPAQGWYSGDIHIHLPRQPEDNARVSAFMAAEDLHAANILQAGNPAGAHFHQYAFGNKGRHDVGSHALIPGIESPRTAVRGHTISLDIDTLYRGSGDDFLYDRALQHYRHQGASTGYAHVGSEEFYASRGLALDVPFGLLDFVEVMQAGQLRTALWYRYLNLGYQLAPAAGSDFPYFEHPGGVRSYVRLDKGWSPEAWIEGLKEGRTYVSNGPLLSFAVNGVGMGGMIDTADGASLHITGQARMNPDLGELETITLVYCGKPVTSSTVTRDNEGPLTLAATLSSGTRGWVALRAEGSGKLSHSAPIYLRPEGKSARCAEEADAALAEVLQSLDALEAHTIKINRELEYWQLDKLEDAYQEQRPALLQRIEKARNAYRQLLTD